MTVADNLLSPHAPASLMQAQACLQRKDLAGFKVLMETGVVNHTDLYGVTPLHLALAHGSTLGARYAVQQGADHTSVDRHDETPLMWACRRPDADQNDLIATVATQVTSQGRNRDLGNMVNHRGENALHIAAAHGQVKTCRVLIETFFANPNAQDRDGNTPLHHLAACDETEGLTVLRAHGADASIANQAGLTPLDLARAQGWTRAVQQLEQPADVQAVLVEALDHMHAMPMSERLRRVRTAIRMGADLSVPLPGAELPLTRAVSYGWEQVVWVLLVDGVANPNGCVNPDQRDHPLYRVVSNRKAVALLLNVLVGAGANLNVQASGQGGQTPLHLAAADLAGPKVEALLDMGANPMLRDHLGRTPLDVLGHTAATSASGQAPTAPARLRAWLTDAQIAWERALLHATVVDATATPGTADLTPRPRPRL